MTDQVQAGDMEEPEITLQEALDAQEMQEEHCVAVLGASDPENCCYSKGYMKRQALYAYLTWNPKGAPFSQPAGICLACSYKCHEGHDLVELFTKRNFRCDCGNKKFSDNPCRLQPNKDDTNSENLYNQNYDGAYCSCQRPYPDPDDNHEAADDPMIQCIVCEDWFHFRHCLSYLNIDFDSITEELELICGPCMGRLDFLGHYAHLAFKPKPEVLLAESTCSKDSGSESSSKENAAVTSGKDHVEDTTSLDSGVDSLPGSDNSVDVSVCQLQKRGKEKLPFSNIHGVGWKDAFRTSLCQCVNCLAMYEKLKVQYLLDAEDTIDHYEALGKKKTEDAVMSAEAAMNNQVNQLGHVGQLELVHGYNFFKKQLADFFKDHVNKGTTVRREDVDKFFAKIKNEAAANKRRRLE